MKYLTVEQLKALSGKQVKVCPTMNCQIKGVLTYVPQPEKLVKLGLAFEFIVLDGSSYFQWNPEQSPCFLWGTEGDEIPCLNFRK